MKPITLHPVSVLVGAALVGLSFVLSGAQTPKLVQHVPRTEVVGLIPAEWWTYAKLETLADGTVTKSLTVPTDRHFVVTRVERNYAVLADGQDVTAALNGASYTEVNPAPVAFAPGTLLTATSNGSGYGYAHLWGYLQEPVN